MSDERKPEDVHNPVDIVELLGAMMGLAAATKQLYDSLLAEGFSPADALTLSGKYLHGFSGGKT